MLRLRNPALFLCFSLCTYIRICFIYIYTYLFYTYLCKYTYMLYIKQILRFIYNIWHINIHDTQMDSHHRNIMKASYLVKKKTCRKNYWWGEEAVRQVQQCQRSLPVGAGDAQDVRLLSKPANFPSCLPRAQPSSASAEWPICEPRPRETTVLLSPRTTGHNGRATHTGIFVPSWQVHN